MSIPNEEELRKIWAEVPADYYYQLNLAQKIWHEWKWLVIKYLISKQKKAPAVILEIGCSSGHLLHLVKNLFPQAKIHGIDVYQPALKEAKKRFPKIHFQIADAHKLPFPKLKFDLVICSETIEHVINPVQVLHEIHRVLKKDGQALIEMDSGSLLFRSIWWCWTKWGRGKVWKDAHLHPFKAHELEKLIRSNGFEIKQKMFSHFGMAVTFLVIKTGRLK